MTIEQLEKRVEQLEQTVLLMARNNVPVVNKVDDTSNKVVEITPYTDSYTAYIGDDDVHFFKVPQGMLSVSVIDSEGRYINYYTVERENDMVSIYFDEPLENVATVSISVQ